MSWEGKGSAMEATMHDVVPPPAFHRSVVRLQCSACGSEANASCNCGKPYIPAAQRVAEYDKANPGRSTRQAAADLGIDQSRVVRARARDAPASGVRSPTPGDQSPPETVTGRDGKTYQAIKPKRPIYEPEPGEDDLIDFIADHFKRLSTQAQVRCAVRLRNIIQGKTS